MPVQLLVCSTHIRVTSVSSRYYSSFTIVDLSITTSLSIKIKSLPISPALSCKSTELIPLADVSDIYNVSTGHELHEFIIRRRQGVTVYFSSQSREQIVKVMLKFCNNAFSYSAP